MEQWFDPQFSGMLGGIFGSLVGICGGLIGILSNYCVRKGRKKLLFRYIGFVLTVCIILFVTGLVALLLRQPYHVWYSFLLPGGIGFIVLLAISPVIKKRFTENELKQMQAKDL